MAVAAAAAVGMFIHVGVALPLWGGSGAGSLIGHFLLRLGLVVCSMSRVVLGWAVALGMAAEVGFQLCERGTFFSTMTYLSLWHSGYT